jgi:hypothetical protein
MQNRHLQRVLRGLGAAAALGAAPVAFAQFTTLMSTAGGGGGDAASTINSSSAATWFGREVVFVSNATDLFGQFTDGRAHVYARDRKLGLIFPLSHNDGAGTGDSGWGPFGERGLASSGTGRFVVYASSVTWVFLGKTTRNFDIFLLDRDPDQNGIFEPNSLTLSLVTRGYDGTEANGHSFQPSVSDDGLYVAYASNATNLVPNDTNGLTDVFLYRTDVGTTARVNFGNAGAQASGGPSRRPYVVNSYTGASVAYTSGATNLVANDTNGVDDVFLYRQGAGPAIVRISVAPDGSQANGPSYATDQSGFFGRYVMIESSATNLIGPGNDTNGVSDVFLFDRDLDSDAIFDEFAEPGATGIVRVSVDSSGAAGNAASTSGTMDLFGRYVAFNSAATNLVGQDADGSFVNVFLHDRDTDADAIFDEAGAISTTIVGLLPNGGQAIMGPGVNDCSISPEGGTVAFGAFNNSPQQVYLRDTETSDLDADGLLDSWELVGIDVAPKDGVTDLTLPFADPWLPNLYVEVDAMTGMMPTNQSVFQAVTNALYGGFDDGDVPITLHILTDPGGNDLNAPLATWTGTMSTWPPEFGPFKQQYFGTTAERASANWPNIRAAKMLAHRYCVFAFDNVGSPVLGQGELPGNDFYVAFGGYPQLAAIAGAQAGVFMHELGHNLGLDHGGADSINFKPNYHSVMNNTWTIPMGSYASSWRLNYSVDQWWPLDETGLPGCLYEPAGIGGAGLGHLGHMVPYGTNLNAAALATEDGQPVDWNMNGLANDVCPKVDINFDAQLSLLQGYDDRANLWWQFGGNVNFNNAVHGAGGFPTSGEIDAATFLALNEMQSWFDTFDTYEPGAVLDVVGGWESWCEDGVDAKVSAEQFLSPPHSLKIEYDGLNQYGTDVVKPFLYTNGRHTFSIWTYVPSTAIGSGYVVMLNEYCLPENNWSLIVEFDATAGIVRDDGGDQLPLIKDQWVEFRAEIDLDKDTLTHFYNGVPLSEGLVWSSNVLPAGVPELAVLDLFSLDITEMYFDNSLIESEFPGKTCIGDFNKDGVLNILDFVAYQNAFVAKDPAADCDANGLFNILDFICYQTHFQAGCP